jgi:hypothetical protein
LDLIVLTAKDAEKFFCYRALMHSTEFDLIKFPLGTCFTTISERHHLDTEKAGIKFARRLNGMYRQN